MYYVYVILLNNNRLYIGYSEDLRRRYYEHLKNKVKSTCNYQIKKLIYYEAYILKSDAMNREKYLKTSKGKKTLKIRLRNILKNK